MNKAIINPERIIVVGGSSNTSKPGGKIIKNLKDSPFKGEIIVVNPKEDLVQGCEAFPYIKKAPECDLAILAIPSKYCLQATHDLIKKNIKAIIIISANFGEVSESGKQIELAIAQTCTDNEVTLIGPNCIGVINENYWGVFTTPIPYLSALGCDFVSSSGSTAVFVMESAQHVGLRFASVYTTGNAAQTAVEDVLKYWDDSYVEGLSSKIKLIYVEHIREPRRFLKYTRSLLQKGCKIAAIKAGATKAGSRAASSHTGALATSDLAIRALFRKAGIVYCSSREELITVASIFTYKELKGENLAVITHAGGTAVLLTDALERKGLHVPSLEGPIVDKLKSYLHPGSSVKNPIDFLATGTAEQLGIIIDYCEHKLPEIDAMIVVFGSPGLFNVENVYKVLSVKLDVCQKPIYPILPSTVNAVKEIEYFKSSGNVNFPDEVALGNALAEVYHTAKPIEEDKFDPLKGISAIRKIIDGNPNGYLEEVPLYKLLRLVDIPMVSADIATSKEDVVEFVKEHGLPIVMKAVGVQHKTDIGGVKLNIRSTQEAQKVFDSLINLSVDATVLMQKQLSGIELFIGAKREPGFGHIIFFGLGGVFVEILKDVKSGLIPLQKQEISRLLKELKSYPVFKGVRGQKGVDEDLFIDLVHRISRLLENAPEIEEMDINPLLADGKSIIAVDARIKLSK